MQQFLLHTMAAYEAFRRIHPEDNAREAAVVEWVNRMPLYEWTRVAWRRGQEAATIGLLCALIIEGRINLSFSRDMDYVCREAMSEDEYKAWAKKHYRK